MRNLLVRFLRTGRSPSDLGSRISPSFSLLSRAHFKMVSMAPGLPGLLRASAKTERTRTDLPLRPLSNDQKLRNLVVGNRHLQGFTGKCQKYFSRIFSREFANASRAATFSYMVWVTVTRTTVCVTCYLHTGNAGSQFWIRRSVPVHAIGLFLKHERFVTRVLSICAISKRKTSFGLDVRLGRFAQKRTVCTTQNFARGEMSPEPSNLLNVGPRSLTVIGTVKVESFGAILASTRDF